MSVLNDCKYIDITNFRGPNLIADEEDLSEPDGLSAKNVEYQAGQVRTRRGFTTVWNPGALIQFMYSWIQHQFNKLIYFSVASSTTGSVLSRNLLDGSTQTLLGSVIAQCMVCVQAGSRLIMAFFDDDGGSSTFTKIWDGTTSAGGPNIEDAFQPTLVSTQLAGGALWGNFTEPGPGVVTAGEHLFMLVPSTWNGFQTRPGPSDTPPRAFTASGGQSLFIEVFPSTTWPTWVKSLQIAMTTVENHERWFLVPDAIFFPLRGSSTHAIFSIDIDDVNLTGNAEDITSTLFNNYTTPTNAHCVIAYNNRVVYLARIPDQTPELPPGSTTPTIFISDAYYPQTINPAENVLVLPEFRDCVTGFSLGSSLYICGPSWTYAFTDNLRKPIFWAPCRRVSGTIGSPFIHGVSTNESAGYAWVADHSGLFFFDGGVFPIMPVSYEQTPDWSRINFSAHAHGLRVIEVPDDRLVIVRVPLDGADHSTHLMAWDYTYGTSPSKIMYCGLWNLADYPGIGDIEIVQSHPSKVKQFWISRGDAPGDVKRRKTIEDGDATTENPIPLFDDSGAGIDSAYKLIAVAQAQEGVQQQVGASFRLRGAGQINIKAYSFDQQRETTMAPIRSFENSMTPGKRFIRLLEEQSEAVSYQVDNGAAPGSFFMWSALRAYFLPWMKERD